MKNSEDSNPYKSIFKKCKFKHPVLAKKLMTPTKQLLSPGSNPIQGIFIFGRKKIQTACNCKGADDTKKPCGASHAIMLSRRQVKKLTIVSKWTESCSVSN